MESIRGRLHKSHNHCVISCVNCGSVDKELAMVAHRNNAGDLVGWVFTCYLCMDKVVGGDITIVIN